MRGSNELVIKFQCCVAICKILQFLEGQNIKKRENQFEDSLLDKKYLPTLNELKNIEKQINFQELLNSSAIIIFDVLNYFKMPKIVWTMVNLLTTLIKKCQFQCNESILPFLENENFRSLLLNRDEMVQDAIIEMCKALISSFEQSPVIFNLCLAIVDIRLRVIFTYFYNNLG